MNKKTQSEQLEEGEIVDDDDNLEDISDNSIIDSAFAFGKFVSSNGHLRALSLSSDSEIERPTIPARRKRKVSHHKCRIKQRKRKRVRLASDSSDSDIIESSQDLKGKLKEAIHISGVEGGLVKNNLETRLKAMGGLRPMSPSTVEAEHVAPEVQTKDTQENKKEESLDKIDDAELENLRMEALKTAMLNKCQRRKRKKALMEASAATPPSQTLENKENDTPQGEQEKKNNGEKAVVDDMEDDEDVLRASLLAALSKTITQKQMPNDSPIQTKEAPPPPPKPPVRVPVLPKRPINKFKHKTLTRIVNKQVINKPIANIAVSKINRPKPQVQPLIINVNCDSDSDEEVKSTTETKAPVASRINNKTIPPKLPELKVASVAPKVADLKAITTNVEKFLKEQRAKFETETQKKSSEIVGANKDKNILEKSAVKLLPKSQQIEYHLLLRRLRNAEKRKLAKKLATERKTLEVRQQTVTATEQQRPQGVVTAEVTPASDAVVVSEKSAQRAESEVGDETIALARRQPIGEVEKSDSDSVVTSTKMTEFSDGRKQRITNELTMLQKTLKEIKMQKNGSLQIKSKYQVLTPIIRKITVASNERKKQERRIKAIMLELNEARSNLTKSHERFSSLVRELVANKEKIDCSVQESKPGERKLVNSSLNKEITLISKDAELGNPDSSSFPMTSTPIKTQVEEAAKLNFHTISGNNECEDMDVCNSDETDICQIDIVDPNDIDQIFKRKPLLKSGLPEYISPLGYTCYERYRSVDPLGIMCPYEVNGMCRDNDCTYKHYLKNL